MSNKIREKRQAAPRGVTELSAHEAAHPKASVKWLPGLKVVLPALLALLIAVGAMAKNGWLPSTDPLTGKKTGWFGKELPKNAPSSWNPLAAPMPDPPPQLSKEYIYAGSRLLAVEDANANAAPPADLAVWRPSNGTWYVWGQSGWVTQGWGQSGDVPAPGDYDGDGKTDFSVFRPSTGVWYVIKSSDGGFVTYTWGNGSDLVPKNQADFDGDGRTDPAVFRPSDGKWYIQGSSAGLYNVAWAYTAGDVPAAADFDGDGRADLALYRSSDKTFRTKSSSTGSLVNYTLTVDGEPASGDYDGDGRADPAVFVAATGSWCILKSTTGSIYTPATWRQSGDLPVQNDYDADGKVDTAVWRPSNGTWYINVSSAGQRVQTWGQSGDIPVPAFYRR